MGLGQINLSIILNKMALAEAITPNGHNPLLETLDTQLVTGNSFAVMVEPGVTRFSVPDDTLNGGSGGRRDAQIFVRMNENLAAAMPGSYVSLDEFYNRMAPGKEFNKFKRSMLVGAYVAQEGWSPAFSTEISAQSETGESNFSLQVYHGALNDHALRMSELALDALESDLGFDDPVIRAHYQVELAEVMKPILSKESDYTIRYVEDCGASGDTILGHLAECLRQDSVQDLRTERIRIDLAVATAQSVLAIQKFAQDNGLAIELNVGHIAFGLSSGIPSSVEGSNARVHANYLTYPVQHINMLQNDPTLVNYQYQVDRLVNLQHRSREWARRTQSAAAGYELPIEDFENADVYVVGDMGDAGKGFSEAEILILAAKGIHLPWNTLRNDPWSSNPGPAWQMSGFAPEVRTDMYFANGGYLMNALNRHFRPGHIVEVNGSPADPNAVNAVIMSGKRAWSKQTGYGVVFDKIPQQVLKVA